MSAGDALGTFKFEVENSVCQDRLKSAPATVNVTSAAEGPLADSDVPEDESLVDRRSREI